MTRSVSVTLCVVTGDDRRATRQFLARVAESIEEHDNVLLVGAGRATVVDDVAAWRLPSAGHELRRPSGETAPRPRRVLVFVEDRAEVFPGWLDILVEAVQAPGVAAVAPRTNVADGDELLVGVPYRPDEPGLRRAFARDLAASARATLTEADLIAGPCIALKRERLDPLGGLGRAVASGYDPATIARTALATGGRLVVAEGCYVHHFGGRSLRPDPRAAGRPLISACMIVRDEEVELPTCLASLAGVADEIVVYDTGSLDRTVEIAEAAGAVVHRGYWDDDFARARNEALSHCRGQWVLWVDADESLVCEDRSGLRSTLESLPTDLEAYIVLIENQNGTKASSTFTHPACRLFRRAYGHWVGHLHELIRAREGTAELARQLTEALRIDHRGYLQSYIASRDKPERNLRTAFGDLAGDSDVTWSMRLVSLGRSYTVAGRMEEGIEHLRRAVEVAELPSTARLALRSIVTSLLALGRPEEALEEIERLRAYAKDQTLADALAGTARLALGEHEAALELLERVHDAIDEDGFEYSASNVAVPKAGAQRALGRPGEAADTLLASIRQSGGVDAHVGLLVECIELAERDLGEIYDAVGSERSEFFVPQLLQLQPDAADRVLDAWLQRAPGSTILLAAASRVAPRLDISRQLVWSSRLREAGFASACPLVVSAADAATPPADRVLAAAAGAVMFSDPRARQVFGAATLAAPRELREELAVQVAAIAPALASVFVDLPSPTRRVTPERRSVATGRRVLVVDRELAALRTAALSALLSEAGHQVTLLQPLPAESSAALLSPYAITVRGWHPPESEEGSWRESCEQALAWSTAEQSYDAVVVAAGALAVLPTIRRLLPYAAIAVDLDSGMSAPGRLEEVDLLLSATGTTASSPVAQVPASASQVLPPRLAPLAARAGVCVVGNVRCAPAAAIDRFTESVAPLLRAAIAQSSIALCGDDPEGLLARSLPSAIVVGPTADPSPWIASARVVLVTHAEGAEHWLAAAAMCGTPALVVPEDVSRAGEVAAAVQALLIDDGLWQQFAPAPPTTRHAEPTADPLARLAPARGPRTRALGEGERPEVRFVGGVYGLESLAQVNRELVTRLAAGTATFDVSVFTRESGPFPRDSTRALTRVRVLRSAAKRAADIEIRHQWPPDFTPPDQGRLVCIQPWEFGGLPAEWIAPLRDVVDDLWVPTSWVRACAVRSGVPEDRVHVVPNGVDVARFRPEGRPYPLRTRKATKLLFVGGLIQRKGVDALLEAYLSSFNRLDDVCLVVKPFGAQSVYRGSTLEREVRQAAASGGPEIEMVDGDLDFDDMAALYRSCDALVHPYRGEGFGMPIAEAMASGLPVIVPNGGACLDFCDEDNAWLIGAREVPILSKEWTPSVPGSWWLEPSRRELGEAMRAALEDGDTAKRKGASGRQRIVDDFTWDIAAKRATDRIEAILGAPAIDARTDTHRIEEHR
jgi:glycosyltransferase involved in cell wall biosynthesis/tetratricopeptide (TPR) repeat protein